MSQSDRILFHLQHGHSITPIYALEEFGCFRLSARINDLRLKGYNITTENETVAGKTFARYFLYAK